MLTPFFLTTRSGDEILVLTARFGNRSCERGFPDAVCALGFGPSGDLEAELGLDAASAVPW